MKASRLFSGEQPPLFSDALKNLPQTLGVETGYLGELNRLARRLAESEAVEDQKWYGPTRAVYDLLAGTDEGVARAREGFLTEWRDGASMDRKIHYWNSPEFRTGHRWILSAMAAQLLILFDWLAAAGAWSEEEIDAICEEALGTFEAYVECHLKGRGRYPILHEPINQGAAMVCGMLYAGYIFGHKWRRDARAQRMHAEAINQLGDFIGQYPANGYDGDGFTYMRIIHHACHTLSVALLEETTGEDWYHRRFAPNEHSLADLNARQLDFVAPGGWSWPLGRYGYIREWNLFMQAYASRRTGDPRYLVAARRDNDEHRYKSPWLGFELGLGLLWYPHEMDKAISSASLEIKIRAECREDAWCTFVDPDSRMHACLGWLAGKAPQFFLEAEGSPLVLGGCETWETSNCIRPDGYEWEFREWMTPPGRLVRRIDLPGLRAAWVDTRPCYPQDAPVESSSRALLQIGDALLLCDRFNGAQDCAPLWQLKVFADTQAEGKRATVRSPLGPTLQIAAAEASFRLTADKQRPPVVPGIESVETRFLVNPSTAPAASFDVAFTWTDHPLAIETKDGNSLSLQHGERRTTILPPLPGASRTLSGIETDAVMAIRDADRLVLAGVRRAEESNGQRLWASHPIDIQIEQESVWIDQLPYGGFVVLEEPGTRIVLRRGNGLEMYARTPASKTIHIRGDVLGVRCNDRPRTVEVNDGWTTLPLPAHNNGSSAVTDELASANDHKSLIAALNRVRAVMAWECIPAVREILRWDGDVSDCAPDSPRTESTHVRLEAAWTLAILGDRDGAGQLIDMIRMEANRDYASDTSNNKTSQRRWAAQWYGSSARVVAIEALLLLGARESLPALEEILAEDTVPHVQDALIRARAVCRPQGSRL